jgi:streptogrisin C
MHRSRALRMVGATLLAAGLAAAALPTASAAPTTAFDQAVQRDLGLSAAEAQTRFAQQDRAAATEAALRKSLGAAFGGAYFDAASGSLVVGVTDRAAASEARAAGAKATVVRYSERQLDAVVAKLDALGTAAGVTGWFADLRANRVVVNVNRAEATAATDAFLAKARGVSDAVRVAEVTASPRVLGKPGKPRPDAVKYVRGGDAWTTLLWRCSVGFSATGATGSKHYVTAGHCTRGAGPANGYDGSAQGTLGGSVFDIRGDYGKVDVTSAEWALAGTVNHYGGGDVAVKGSTEAPVGAAICRSGSTTDWHCGTILAKNQTVIYIDGNIVTGLTHTDACAEPGDSGGSYITGTGQAQGMTSGGSGDCKEGGETYFQPVNEALQAYGLRLVTS